MTGPVLPKTIAVLAFLAVERRSLLLSSASGLTLGLYAITRPNILIFFPVAVWWVWRATREFGRRKALLLAGLLALGCVLPPGIVREPGGPGVPRGDIKADD